jgi:sensor histidine kinase regulating citrate/malate metabolism
MGIDAHGRIQYANPQAKQLLNCEISIGTSLKTIDPGLADEVISCIKQGKDKYRFTIKRQDDGIEILISLVRNDTGITGATCFIQSLEDVETAALRLPHIKEMNLQFGYAVAHLTQQMR